MCWDSSWKRADLCSSVVMNGMAASLHPSFSGGIEVFYVPLSGGGYTVVEEH